MPTGAVTYSCAALSCTRSSPSGALLPTGPGRHDRRDRYPWLPHSAPQLSSAHQSPPSERGCTRNVCTSCCNQSPAARALGATGCAHAPSVHPCSVRVGWCGGEGSGSAATGVWRKLLHAAPPPGCLGTVTHLAVLAPATCPLLRRLRPPSARCTRSGAWCGASPSRSTTHTWHGVGRWGPAWLSRHKCTSTELVSFRIPQDCRARPVPSNGARGDGAGGEAGERLSLLEARAVSRCGRA